MPPTLSLSAGNGLRFAIRYARRFLFALPPERRYPSTVSPDAEGVVFALQDEEEVLVLVDKSGNLHLAHRRNGRTTEYVDDVVFFGLIPAAILDHIPLADIAHESQS